MKDRLTLGTSALRVSPFCLGIVGQPEIVAAAYCSGINFFFASADMHWPLHEPVREGLRQLLRTSSRIRERVVVAVVSYVTQPEFCAAPFDEVLQAVPELGYVDLAVIGGAYRSDFPIRLESFLRNRSDESARSLFSNFAALGSALAKQPLTKQEAGYKESVAIGRRRNLAGSRLVVSELTFSPSGASSLLRSSLPRRARVRWDIRQRGATRRKRSGCSGSCSEQFFQPPPRPSKSRRTGQPSLRKGTQPRQAKWKKTGGEI